MRPSFFGLAVGLLGSLAFTGSLGCTSDDASSPAVGPATGGMFEDKADEPQPDAPSPRLRWRGDLPQLTINSQRSPRIEDAIEAAVDAWNEALLLADGPLLDTAVSRDVHAAMQGVETECP